jgi:hypothetical protein
METITDEAMRERPARAGISTYEVHPVRGFPGSCLPG